MKKHLFLSKIQRSYSSFWCRGASCFIKHLKPSVEHLDGFVTVISVCLVMYWLKYYGKFEPPHAGNNTDQNGVKHFEEKINE